jgi:hypothetical protein
MRKFLIWIGLFVPFGLGPYLWIARPFDVTTPRVIAIVGGALLVVAGLLFLWGARTGGLEQNQTRMNAAALILWGISQFLPWPYVRLTLTITAAAILWAAALRRPRQLFLPKVLSRREPG